MAVSTTSMRVLLVERDAATAERLARALGAPASLGVELTRAAGADEAAKLLATAFDVVLVGRGEQALGEIARAAGDVPLVAVTEGWEGADVDAATRAGADDCLPAARLDAHLLVRVARHATLRRHAGRRAHFLVDAGKRIAAAPLDVDAVYAAAVDCAVPELGDGCVLHVIAEPHVLECAAVRHVHDGVRAELAKACARAVSADEPANAPFFRAARSGEPVVDCFDGWAGALAAGGARHALSVAVVGAARRPLGILTVFTSDATRRYADDDASVAADLASRAGLAIEHARVVRTRDDTLAMVSHDLRNPLNVVTVASASLQAGHVTAERQRSYFEKIRRAGERMNRLIQDILDVSRLESGVIPFELADHEASSIVNEALESVRPLADEKGIALDARVDADLPTVNADRDRLLQLFGNLLGNALKFTPKGGRVTVSAARAQKAPSAVHFLVADTGPGIDAEDLPRIFDRFYRSRRKTGVGTGLGLAIARAIVTAHDGRIWAESEPGKGARLHVTLPAQPLHRSPT